MIPFRFIFLQYTMTLPNGHNKPQFFLFCIISHQALLVLPQMVSEF
ncbi:hypothetical protein GPAL_2723 [Glaciecola pallidula DSM 14239 = ACAM 615]|uniref:Uncharacterized protein n=1 Tax=Brumicola pallidula DSM 14239 = ACAM 615 TaxID=1121922 RepID=K6YA01_9ALTE|nr:hypothetical protein GPAL_2723 [Glaciecola pallidula DSM 14239 = ACAM 615]